MFIIMEESSNESLSSTDGFDIEKEYKKKKKKEKKRLNYIFLLVLMDFKYIIYIFLVTFIFTFYVEYSVGNIIFRETAKGIKEFQPINILHYLIDPLHNGFLWNYKLLDVNYIFTIVIATILYHNRNY